MSDNVWIKVDSHDTAKIGGEMFVRAEAIDSVSVYVQQRPGTPIPGETSRPPMVNEARGTTLRTRSGTTHTVTGLTPRQIVNMIQGRAPGDNGQNPLSSSDL